MGTAHGSLQTYVVGQPFKRFAMTTVGTNSRMDKLMDERLSDLERVSEDGADKDFNGMVL